MSSAFELTLSLPSDQRYAVLLRALAVEGARHAGLNDADTELFGRRVEAAAGEALARGGAPLTATVRHTDGPVEVTIGSCCVSTTR